MKTLIKPKIPAPLDPDFQPAALFNRRYVRTAKASGKSVPLVLGLERGNGIFSRWETLVNSSADADSLRYVERIVKFMLWSRGGWRLRVGGPKPVGEYIQRCYSIGGERGFDRELMARIYERPFEVESTDEESVPDGKEMNARLGGHLDGCRIGFDLGASDYKIAALKEGKVIYSDEFSWNPRDEADPEYHYSRLNAGLKKAAGFLPRVDAIGGSSAGVIVDNKIMVASLFRSVAPSQFDRAKNIFLRIRDEWKVPLEVANDGEVTALAGAMSLEANGMIGLAMGSSAAAGYIDPQGCMTGWLNELAFAPVDYNENAASDEWSGDRGVGALYFSQQAVNRLLPAAGIHLPKEMGLPERLEKVQDLMAKGEPRAAKIYETIGVYLGYTVAHYADFYEFGRMLLLGRVTTGKGGDIAVEKAREVLKEEFPKVSGQIQLHMPDEKSRRVGQAVAAASLPVLKS